MFSCALTAAIPTPTLAPTESFSTKTVYSQETQMIGGFIKRSRCDDYVSLQINSLLLTPWKSLETFSLHTLVLLKPWGFSGDSLTSMTQIALEKLK